MNEAKQNTIKQIDVSPQMVHRGAVRTGATGAIAPVDFQKTPFAPINFPKTFRKDDNLTIFDWIWVIR